MWPYFAYNNISYDLRKGPIFYLLSTQHIKVLIPFNLRDPGYGIIFVGILNLANEYLNLKPKLRTFGNIDCGYVIYS